jgi:hypothetical protein
MSTEFKAYIQGLTEETTPDTAADFIPIIDTSGNVVKKVKPTNLGVVPNLTESVQDIIGGNIVAGSNVTVSYNDTTGNTTISSAGTSINTVNLSGGNMVALSSYASLSAALTAIGTTVRTPLLIDEDQNVSAATTVTDNVTLVEGGGRLTKTSSGSIEFQGLGLANPESRNPIFSGFAAGNVTWSGTVPERLSTELWANAAWSDRLENAVGATTGKQLTIVTFPGAHSKQVNLGSGRSYHLTRGTYTDTMNVTDEVRFIVGDNTVVYGDGIGQTIYEASSLTRNCRIFAADGVISGGLDGYNENIEVRDFWVKGSNAVFYDNGPSVFLLGNCKNGHARNIKITDMPAYGIYFGGFSTSGFKARDCSITGCTFSNVHGQNAGCLNGDNILISCNLFTDLQQDPTGTFISVVDCEPNTTTDVINNVQIINNIFDGRTAQQYYNGIIVQAGGATAPCRSGRIAGNIFLTQGNTYLSNPIIGAGLEDFIIKDNFAGYAGQSGLALYDCKWTYVRNNTFQDAGHGGIDSMTLEGCRRCFIEGNIIDNSKDGYYNLGATVEESEMTGVVNTSGVNVTRVSGNLFRDHWVGDVVTINSVDYVIATVAGDLTHLTLTGSAGTQSSVALTTKFSNNRYINNRFIQYTLLNTSTVVSAMDRTIGNSVAVTIAAQQNDFNPTYPNEPTYRIDVTATGAQSITGLTWNAASVYNVPVDGEEHMIYNAGASAVTLEHEHASSTAANRFKSTTGADIVLAQYEAAKLIYITTLGRWWAYKL